ncbi:ABC transporter permease [Tropicimonas sp. IMCC34043]|uniref:ABC transporter permease n=1 Tax=Tropicimonas sp. IMCC34043 TaxID=2248760 RepID=UPI000E24A1CE|nr:ABC transporter permease [Tropicimonas sp. IMCC34043]
MPVDLVDPFANEAEETARPMRDLIRSYFRSPIGTFGLVLMVLIVLAAVFAPFLSFQNPYDLLQLDILDGQLKPGETSAAYGYPYMLGTDDQGRDMFSAILYGLRISLGVGILSATTAALIGATLGLVAAYHGGRLESIIMRLVDFQLSFPTILVALMILAVMGKGIGNVILALVLVEWATFARTARGVGLVESRKDYIEASHVLGVPSWRILLRHLLPNCIPPLIVIATVQVARAISLEATLSFLGVGVPITEPSLGLLISNGYQYMFSGMYWMSVFPGLALLVTIVAINLVGDRLRDVLNPRKDT